MSSSMPGASPVAKSTPPPATQVLIAFASAFEIAATLGSHRNDRPESSMSGRPGFTTTLYGTLSFTSAFEAPRQPPRCGQLSRLSAAEFAHQSGSAIGGSDSRYMPYPQPAVARSR